MLTIDHLLERAICVVFTDRSRGFHSIRYLGRFIDCFQSKTARPTRYLLSLRQNISKFQIGKYSKIKIIPYSVITRTIIESQVCQVKAVEDGVQF